MNIESFIWGICDDVLRGLFKQHEYGDVILPFLVLRRLDCVQEEHKDEVVKLYSELKDKFDDPSDIIHTKLNINFSNHSRYDLRRLVNEPSKLNENLYEYLRSFSPNVQDIVQNFGLQKHIEKLEENNSLYILIEKFSEVDLHPSKVDNHLMGSIFEELLRKFSEMSNETSGEHYTPRDIVNLLVSLVLSPELDELSKPNKIVSLYDPCCGTGGMLTIGKKWIQDNVNKEVEVNMFGQELNPQTYSICKSDFLITNEQPQNIKLGSTLSRDGYSENDRKFDYMICNPPYGISWKKEEVFIKQEHMNSEGRFPLGLPSISDGQLLFLQHMISKMDKKSRIGLIFNVSPLVTGKSNQGPSDIRKWLLENDYLETIVQLPEKMFFNTPITTYIWILSNNKTSKRKGKLQLIDSSSCFNSLKKNLGQKSNEITEEHMEKIVSEYKNFEDTKISKIKEIKEFGYTDVELHKPLIKEGKVVKNKKGEPTPDKTLKEIERVPLLESVQSYFEREIKPFSPESWFDESKNKTGYQINFNKYYPTKSVLVPSLDIFKGISETNGSIDFSHLNKITTRGMDSSVEMKSSGFDWIGDIPKHWDVVRMSFLFRPISIKNHPDEQNLSVYRDYGVIPRDSRDDNRNILSEDLSGYKLVNEGDFVLNKMKCWMGSLGVSEYRGIVSPSYIVMEPLSENHNKYLHYLLRSDTYISQYKRLSYGVRPGQWDFHFEDFRELPCIIPPIEEQIEIVKYINSMMTDLDQIIEKEEKKLKLLKQYKKSFLSENVKGLRYDK